VGCGEDVPTFPEPERDAGIECTEGAAAMDGSSTVAPAACPSGQTCLQGRCYERCADDADCARSESCSSGVCVSRTMPTPDAGTDAGDPCAALMCEAPTPVCDPIGGGCVACLDSSTCGGATPICDVAHRTCVAFNAGECRPCTNDFDCVAVDMTDFGDCLDRGDEHERVCVVPCADDAACNPGFGCDTTSHCTPRVGSCTGWLAAFSGQACAADAECVPVGVTPAPGQCGSAMTCLQPCGDAMFHCPAGYTCPSEFCEPM